MRCLMGFALASVAVGVPQLVQAETLVENVHGITVDDSDRVISFRAMLVGDDGKVRSLYSAADALPSGVETRIDGRGRTLIPGLIDSHVHLSALGAFASRLDLSAATSLAEANRTISAHSVRFPGTRWITGRGWNPAWWGDNPVPSAGDIALMAGTRPVWLVSADGKMGLANEAALALAGITASTPDPDAGRIERGADGEPTGLLAGSAMELVAAAMTQSQSGERDAAFLAAQREFHSRGITAVAELAMGLDDWLTFRRAGDANRLQIRIMAYAAGVATAAQIGGSGPTPWLYNDRLRLNGVKLFTDGGLHARDAWLKAPYSDDPGNVGARRMTGPDLRAAIDRAARDGFQVAIHAIGDAANTEMLDALDELAPKYPGDRRWLNIHAQIVDPADLARFGRHGIIASMSPIHATADWRIDEARLGPDRLAGAHAWRSIRATSAKLAFGSDVPIYSPDVFAGIAAAISRTDANGEPAGGWRPEETIDRASALAAYTSWGAYAGFGETLFGRLAPGMHADFVLIDTDPMTATPAEIRATTVEETWVDGVKVFDLRRDGAPAPIQWLLRESDAH